MGETATRNRNGVSRDRHVADNFSMLTVETLTHPLIDLLSHAPPDETRRNEAAGRLHPGMAHRMKSIKNRMTHGTGTRGRNTPVEKSPKRRMSAAGTVMTTKEEEVRRAATSGQICCKRPISTKSIHGRGGTRLQAVKATTTASGNKERERASAKSKVGGRREHPGQTSCAAGNE
jgi:hypothetical protein